MYRRSTTRVCTLDKPVRMDLVDHVFALEVCTCLIHYKPRARKVVLSQEDELVGKTVQLGYGPFL